MSHFSGLTPEEVVFIDDRARFLIPARTMGMKTILAVNSPQVIKDIRKLLTKEH